MRRFILTLAVFLSALAIAAPAAAGGWAVSTLDALPAPEPGEPIEIGFTIRAHGVTPVTVEDGPVGIEIVTLDGTATFFEAIADGPVGHYVATVVFPAAGDYRWAVSQGWYRSQSLGTITIGPGPLLDPIEAGYRWPAVVRYGLPASALVLLALSALIAAGARRPEPVAAP